MDRESSYFKLGRNVQSCQKGLIFRLIFGRIKIKSKSILQSCPLRGHQYDRRTAFSFYGGSINVYFPSINEAFSNVKGLSAVVGSSSVDEVSTKKSTSAYPLMAFLEQYLISCSPSLIDHFMSRPDASGYSNTCLSGESVRTFIGCDWKYGRNFLVACTKAKPISPKVNSGARRL